MEAYHIRSMEAGVTHTHTHTHTHTLRNTETGGGWIAAHLETELLYSVIFQQNKTKKKKWMQC